MGAIFGKVWILKCMSLSLIFNHCVHKLGYRILRKVSGRELLKKSHPSKNTFRIFYSCHGGQKVGLGLQMNWWESFLAHLNWLLGLHIFLHISAHLQLWSPVRYFWGWWLLVVPSWPNDLFLPRLEFQLVKVSIAGSRAKTKWVVFRFCTEICFTVCNGCAKSFFCCN